MLIWDHELAISTYRKCSKIRALSKIRAPQAPYKAKKKEKWELMAFLLNNFFKKK
jgi:type VI protein secretion system component VasA